MRNKKQKTETLLQQEIRKLIQMEKFAVEKKKNFDLQKYPTVKTDILSPQFTKKKCRK